MPSQNRGYMFQKIPLTTSPSQTLDTILSGQFVSIFLQSRDGNLYIDVYLNNQPVVLGRACQNQNMIINEAYRGFKGELFFIDTVGSNDPSFSELNSRFQLIYWDGENE